MEETEEAETKSGTQIVDCAFLQRVTEDLESRKSKEEERQAAKEEEMAAICTFQPTLASSSDRQRTTDVWESLYKRSILREERFCEVQQKRIAELKEQEVEDLTFRPANGKTMWKRHRAELKKQAEDSDSVAAKRGMFRCSTTRGKLQGNFRSCTDVYGQLFEPQEWEPSRRHQAPMKNQIATILEPPGRPPGQPMDDPNSLEPRNLFKRGFLRYTKHEEWRRARLEEFLKEEEEACTFKPDPRKVRKETMARLKRTESAVARKKNRAIENPRRRIDIVKPLFEQMADIMNKRKDDGAVDFKT